VSNTPLALSISLLEAKGIDFKTKTASEKDSNWIFTDNALQNVTHECVRQQL
jgi:hypothetical protein